jgi:hypothetical protein
MKDRWKEAEMASSEALPRALYGWTDENHEILESVYLVSGWRFEPRTS